MRTCEERARDVLERRDAHQKKRRKREAAIAFGGLCLTLALSIGIGMLPRAGQTPDRHTPKTPSTVQTASYAQLYDVIRQVKVNYDGYYFTDYGVAVPETGATNDGVLPSSPHSDTNVQVAGVGEADVVKTDGRYLYLMHGDRVVIVDTNTGAPRQVTAFYVPKQDGEYGHNTGLYLSGGRLIVTQYRWDDDERRATSAASIYDVSVPSSPKFINRFEQDGTEISTRLVGDVLYTVSRYQLYKEPVAEDITTFVPTVRCGGVVEPLPIDDVCIQTPDRGYVVVTAVKISGAGEMLSHKAVLTDGQTVYANTENLYVAGANTRSADETPITRFALNGGKLEVAAEGCVPGVLINQFALDEYEGHLRVVTTRYRLDDGSETGLYVLDASLRVVGSLTGLAKGERVYAVRFDGAIGYFVTFRQVDPLFTVELSDPTAPRILNALKIPGFSQYLHPYGQGKLLGIGRAATEDGRATFVKLSMFDVSDPTAVTESHVYTLDQTYTEALYDHKAVLADVEKNLIGFATGDDLYRVFRYTGDGFEQMAQLPTLGGAGVRGVYIGEFLYVASAHGVIGYRLSDFTATGMLSVVEPK